MLYIQVYMYTRLPVSHKFSKICLRIFHHACLYMYVHTCLYMDFNSLCTDIECTCTRTCTRRCVIIKRPEYICMWIAAGYPYVVCVVSLWVWPPPLQTVAGDVGGNFKQLFTRNQNILKKLEPFEVCSKVYRESFQKLITVCTHTKYRT